MLAVLTNLLIVSGLSGWFSAALFGVFVLPVAIFLPKFLFEKHYSVNRSVGFTLLIMLILLVLMIGAYGVFKQVNPVTDLHAQFSVFVDQLITAAKDAGTDWANDKPPEILKHDILVELPSAVAVFALIMTWANLVLLARLSPKDRFKTLGLDLNYFRQWKAPEFLLWPTIAAGALLVFGNGWIFDLGLNVFKFLMAIFAIQGISILSFLFDRWKIQGFFRSAAYLLVVFLMMPLLLAVGFFDQWFDFRAKLRQS